MINYFMKKGVSQIISFDPETENIDSVEYMNSHVDWMYSIPEDGVLSMNGIKKDVKKGDIIIKFYPTIDYESNPFVVIRNKEWKQNIAAEKKYHEELLAKKEADNAESCCGDCESCVKCGC